jgi:hypothetical protein
MSSGRYEGPNFFHQGCCVPKSMWSAVSFSKTPCGKLIDIRFSILRNTRPTLFKVAASGYEIPASAIPLSTRNVAADTEGQANSCAR